MNQMSDKEKKIYEGSEKRGGEKPAPTTVKPDYKPPPQKPQKPTE